MAFTLWFTGLPASGKTTLAQETYNILEENGYRVELIDSDSFVQYLGEFFEPTTFGRALNVRTMAIVSSFLNKHNIICLVAATTAHAKIWGENRKLIDNYIEVYCKCSLDVAEKRDPKGLYKLARKGLISEFTGVGGVYEEPTSPGIVVSTDEQSVSECLHSILAYLEQHQNIHIKE